MAGIKAMTTVIINLFESILSLICGPRLVRLAGVMKNVSITSKSGKNLSYFPPFSNFGVSVSLSFLIIFNFIPVL